MCDRPCDKSKCRNKACANQAITSGDYSLKPRPNLFDLAIMDGFLTGGGNAPSVQRTAYWAHASSTPYYAEEAGDIAPGEHPLYDDLDDL
ncbi:MAG: hypothetical protein HRT94_08965 [Alphaproteobacteria bacterium]|nr:hypothetical protein [Alphaproteobacteria bacterium]